ncbi:MAG TPA: hypothetical protein VFS02_08395, partial [Telluria sp.]|nr:hypothetical protein [Telluria sp.]
SVEQTAQAAALATCFVVKECASQIGAESGLNVAAYGLHEGCKPSHAAWIRYRAIDYSVFWTILKDQPFTRSRS